MTLLIGSLQLGLLYGVMVLGIYISFRILNVPDLTAEGSFTFGLAVSALCTVSGHPFLGILGAMAAGGLAGSITGILQTRLKIHPVLTGILTMSGLYSVNMLVLGGTPNLALIGKDTLFSLAAAGPFWRRLFVQSCWRCSFEQGWACASGPPGTMRIWSVLLPSM